MIKFVQYSVEGLQVQCCWSFKCSVHCDSRQGVLLLCAWLQLLWAGTAWSWQSLCIASQSTSLAVCLSCSVFCGLSCIIYNYFNILGLWYTQRILTPNNNFFVRKSVGSLWQFKEYLDSPSLLVNYTSLYLEYISHFNVDCTVTNQQACVKIFVFVVGIFIVILRLCWCHWLQYRDTVSRVTNSLCKSIWHGPA
jgi:hypothetical protein